MPPKTVDPDKQLAERLLTWHKPSSDGVANSLDSIRSRFLALANFVVKTAPPSEDRTRAIWLIGDACRQAVYAVVANQEAPAPEPPTEYVVKTPSGKVAAHVTEPTRKATRARKAAK